jgi:hypothetical protein
MIQARWVLYIQWGTKETTSWLGTTCCTSVRSAAVFIRRRFIFRWKTAFLKMKTVADAYSGKVLPFHVAMLVGSSVRCQETGKSFVLEDIDQVYLAPVLRR